MLKEVGLTDSNKRISGYSRGMKQRLGLAQALLTEPEILICDEPTSALDPVGRREILSILANSKGKRTVLFSTHILSDVESICDQVAILHQGTIVAAGPLDSLKRRGGQYRYEILMNSVTEAQDLLTKLPADSQQQDALIILPVKEDTQKFGRKLLQIIEANDFLPLSFRLVEPSLEELFMEVIAQ